MKNLYLHSKNNLLVVIFLVALFFVCLINNITQLSIFFNSPKNYYNSILNSYKTTESKENTILNGIPTANLVSPLGLSIEHFQSQKLVPSTPMNGGHFGRSVYIDGNYAVIGAYKEATGGAAYIYKLEGNQWIEEAKITGNDTKEGDYFGFSVMIKDDYIVVGAVYGGSFRQGTAYIYKREGKKWTQQQKIEASDSETNAEYGICVAIAGEYIIIGAQRNSSQGTNAGSAYIYKKNGANWTQEQKLIGDNTSENDRFGHSVSISGDDVVIGAILEGVGGSAYIFKRNGTNNWTQQQKITSNDIQSGDYFGRPVFISGDYIIVGADEEDTGATDAGAAYIFKRNGTVWTQEAKLQSLDRDNYDRFGNSVKIDGNVAVMGAYLEGVGGSVYTFKRNGTDWIQQTKITADDIQAVDNFGYGCSMFGKYLFVGAFAEDRDGMTNAGAAYIFTTEQVDVDIKQNDRDSTKITHQKEVKNDIIIYPNPNTGTFNVHFETVLLENTEVTIFDGIGRKIHTQIFEKGNQEFVIDVKNQPKGMYLIHFSQNGATYSKQIVIE